MTKGRAFQAFAVCMIGWFLASQFGMVPPITGFLSNDMRTLLLIVLGVAACGIRAKEEHNEGVERHARKYGGEVLK